MHCRFRLGQHHREQEAARHHGPPPLREPSRLAHLPPAIPPCHRSTKTDGHHICRRGTRSRRIFPKPCPSSLCPAPRRPILGVPAYEVGAPGADPFPSCPRFRAISLRLSRRGHQRGACAETIPASGPTTALHGRPQGFTLGPEAGMGHFHDCGHPRRVSPALLRSVSLGLFVLLVSCSGLEPGIEDLHDSPGLSRCAQSRPNLFWLNAQVAVPPSRFLQNDPECSRGYAQHMPIGVAPSPNSHAACPWTRGDSRLPSAFLPSRDRTSGTLGGLRTDMTLVASTP
jgi:hypothetical protein